MPFKPRIVRFDDEHAAPSGPATAALGVPHETQTPPHDPVHDTVRDVEFDTLRDWDPDDALLADAKLQCLARQLSDDAARLAARYPADGWTPPTAEPIAAEPAVAEEPTPNARPLSRRRAWIVGSSLAAAVAGCVAIVAALPPGSPDGPRSLVPSSTTPSAAPAQPHSSQPRSPATDTYVSDHPTASPAAHAPLSRIKYEHGDAARWGDHLIDDSQFGESAIGVLRSANGEIVPDALPPDIAPGASHDYCEVSM